MGKTFFCLMLFLVEGELNVEVTHPKAKKKEARLLRCESPVAVLLRII